VPPESDLALTVMPTLQLAAISVPAILSSVAGSLLEAR
jgi:hypothetical protein